MTRRRQAGFTLMEVLVSSVLIATVFVAVVSLMSQSLRNIARMTPHEIALTHAREKMTDVLLRDQLALEHLRGRWDDGYRWQLDVRPLVAANQQPPAAGTPALFKVRVEIAWGDASPRTYAVETVQSALVAPPVNRF